MEAKLWLNTDEAFIKVSKMVNVRIASVSFIKGRTALMQSCLGYSYVSYLGEIIAQHYNNLQHVFRFNYP